MEPSKAHLITLWCAVLSKSDRGISRILPKGLPIVQARVLAQFTMPSTSCVPCVRLARALVLRPADVEAAVVSLESRNLICEAVGSDGDAANEHVPHYKLTFEGQEIAEQLLVDLGAFFELCRARLEEGDRLLLAQMMLNALTRPGSFYTRMHHDDPLKAIESPILRMTASSMMQQAINATVKSSTGLSLTDFRFLLELYPKKRGIEKQLRAKDMVSFLRTGRSYVTTSSLRLEEMGYILRIPDVDDARGILFQLTPTGSALVQSTGEDVFAVCASLFGSNMDNRHMIHALKLLLEGHDDALDKLDGLI